MKNLFPITILAFSLLSLNACVSISNTIDDDVYVMKGAQIPVDESLDDETSYSAYKYKKDRDNNNVRYASNSGFRNSPFNNRMLGYSSLATLYSPYSHSPYFYGTSGFYSNVNWRYIPGYGWTANQFYSPYGYNGYYGYYGYNGYNYGYYPQIASPYYGGFYSNYNSMYMVGNGYEYAYMYGNNPYLSNYQNGYSQSNSGNTLTNYHSGPRGNSGGGGVVTRNSIPGTLKSTSSQPVVSTKPVGQKEILARNSSPTVSSSRPTATNRPTTDNISYSRPGRIENSGSTTGRTYSGNTTGRTTGVSGRDGSSSSSSRTSSPWEGGSRTSGTIHTSSDRSGGLGGNSGGSRNSSGGSHSGGSVGGARR